ncbi:MAG: hypothetical protein KJ737_23065 [Proteobacteria bacterium]|nr:hypothetical protein [Pseudomonadota bacterium]
MGTIEITGNVNDGWVENSATFWDTCRQGFWGNSFSGSETENPGCLEAGFEGGLFAVSRVFLYFDLSTLTLPKYAKIIGARLKIYGYGYSSAQKLSVQEGTQGETLSLADYSQFTGPLFGVNVFDFDASGVNAIAFNGDGLSYLNQKIGSMAKLCLREYDHDFLDSQPNDIFKSGIYFADVSVSDRKPVLELTYVSIESPVTLSGSASDGEVYRVPDGTWQENLDEETGDVVATDQADFYIEDDGNANRRFFFYFDGSDFPNGITVTGVTFSVYGSVSDPGDEGIGASLFKGTQNDVLTVEDYDAFTGNVLSSLDPDDGESGWFDFVLNAEGISAVNDMLSQTGKSIKFCLRSTRFDVNRETPLGSPYALHFAIKSADDPDPALHPKVVIAFDLPADQGNCEANGWYWYDGACHLELPNNPSECEENGYYWYGDACHLDLPDNESECSGYSYYWYYGECRLSNKVAVFPCVCIDTLENIWLVAGHEILEINEVFVSLSGSDEPRLRTTGFERLPAYDYEKGLHGKIAVIRFTSDPPDPNGKVWCNVKGMKNKSGSLIENPIEIITHFLTNYLAMTSSHYNETGFESARLLAESDGHKGAGMIKDHPKGIDVIQEVAKSIGATLFFDRDGKLNIKGLT